MTEDRKIEGFFETMSIADNIHMGLLGADLDKGAVVRMSEVRSIADQWVKRLNIRAIDSNARVIELSGGNQQKVVIASALVQRPKLIIFDEPTRGVDVGAISEIHELINRSRRQRSRCRRDLVLFARNDEPIRSHSGLASWAYRRGVLSGAGDGRTDHVCCRTLSGSSSVARSDGT